VAHLSSDAIISVVPSLAAESEFSAQLKQYAQNKASSVICRHVPELLSVRANADPLLDVYHRVRHGQLVSVTTASSVLVQSIPHLYRLAHHPVVIHVALHPTGFPDYGDITSIRNTGFTFLQSSTLQEAQDLALTAHALAIRSGRGVIHFFDAANSRHDQPIAHESRDLVASILGVDTARQYQTGSSEESSIYVSERLSTRHSAPGWNGSSGTAAAAPPSTSASAAATRDPSTASEASSDRKNSSSGASEAESATTLDSTSSAKPVSSADIDDYCTAIWAQIKSQTGRQYSAFNYTGKPNAENALFLFGSDPGLFSAELDSATPSDFLRVDSPGKRSSMEPDWSIRKRKQEGLDRLISAS
jgi:sulfite reductase (NADPH) hemoprotein beta-component